MVYHTLICLPVHRQKPRFRKQGTRLNRGEPEKKSNP
jgi:hypothetical protein